MHFYGSDENSIEQANSLIASSFLHRIAIVNASHINAVITIQ